jgi:hypothetical protein
MADKAVVVFVVSDDETQLLKAAEVLSRAVVGLGLDGIPAMLRVGDSEIGET